MLCFNVLYYYYYYWLISNLFRLLLLLLRFLSLNRAIGPFGSFWLYAALSAIGWCWLLFVLPETKGKTLEQIGKIFK